MSEIKTLGTYLKLELEDTGEYVRVAGIVVTTLKALMPVINDYRAGNLDEDGLMEKVKELASWRSDMFQPHRTGFCRMVREICRQENVRFYGLLVPLSPFHSNNADFPVKSYTGSPDDAYLAAAEEGTMWKDTYGRSRLRALETFIVGVEADIDAVKEGQNGAISPEQVQANLADGKGTEEGEAEADAEVAAE